MTPSLSNGSGSRRMKQRNRVYREFPLSDRLAPFGPRASLSFVLGRIGPPMMGLKSFPVGHCLLLRHLPKATCSGSRYRIVCSNDCAVWVSDHSPPFDTSIRVMNPRSLICNSFYSSTKGHLNPTNKNSISYLAFFSSPGTIGFHPPTLNLSPIHATLVRTFDRIEQTMSSSSCNGRLSMKTARGQYPSLHSGVARSVCLCLNGGVVGN